MAWQAAQTNSTFESAAPTPERDHVTFPEAIALNSESDQTLRDAIEVKSSHYLGAVSLTNDRPSRILQAAHLAIADQSPFNLRNTDPKLSIKELNRATQKGGAPRVVAEVEQSSVPVPLPLPPRSNFDAAGQKLSLPAAIEASPAQPAAIDSYRATAESYRGAESYRPVDSHRASNPDMLSTVVAQTSSLQSFSPDQQSGDARLTVEGGHVKAAWGLSEEPSALRGALNSLLPTMGSSPKKASVSFEHGLSAAKVAPTADSNNLKAIKAGDALHTGRMGTSSARLKDSNRMQNCSSLPLFDAHSMKTKFQADNVTFSKSISPNGERTQVQTAPDFSSITEVWTPSSGGYLYKSVYRDELNRVRYEESVNEQGLRTIVQTGYCDKEDKKSPFVAYKMVIRPDGTRELLA